jgi:hypothetical protein
MEKNIKRSKNPFLLFLPFLIIFIIYVVLNPTHGNQGDESRYLKFAHNLLHGFYSPPMPGINLTNGPGYPIILTPFLGLGLPLICLTILNAVFYYLSIVFLFKALQRVVSERITLIFSFFWACYYIAYQNMPFTHTETFTYLLISMLIYYLVRVFEPGSPGNLKKYIFLAGFFIGYIVLTKIAFVYVLLVMFLGSAIVWLTNRKDINYRKGILIMLVGLATFMPYAVYTYHLTGRMFYWNTNTGVSMYWSTSPYPDEYGDWKQDLTEGTLEKGNFNIPGAGDSLVARHQKDYDEIFPGTGFRQEGMAQDDAFRKKALNNIKEHPLKYLQNCVYNVGRLVFHYPFSQAVERPKILLVFPVNGIIFTLMLFCLIPTLLHWRRLPYAIKFMLFFAFFYLGLSAMVTAYVRMFTIIVPVLLFWFALIIQKTVKVNFDFDKEN